MRYSVKYECVKKIWIVSDSTKPGEIIGEHFSKTSAYRQAHAEQEFWRQLDPISKHLEKVREIIPQTLVIR
jgi:hypothetical protein